MRIGFVVNDVASEKPEYTTVRLARVAAARGHDTWLMGVGDFSQHADDTVAVHARRAFAEPDEDEPTFLARVQDEVHQPEPVAVADLDVLVMRNDPADDMTERPWAVTSGVLFAQ
jgi:glutathione synthase